VTGTVASEHQHELRLKSQRIEDLETIPSSYRESEYNEHSKKQSHTRSSISTVDRLVFFRHWDKVPFVMYGDTMKNCDVASFS